MLIALVVSTGFAQTDDYEKNEFYVGYSNNQIDYPARRTFHGIEGSYTRNVSRFFGVRADFSFARNNGKLYGSLTDPVTSTYNFQQTYKSSISNFLGGIQIKDNSSKKRFKPFAYALGGVAVNRRSFEDVSCISQNCPAIIPIVNFSGQNTGVAGAFGAGLDIKAGKHIDLRAIQIDYNPIYSNGRVNNNFRIGFGLVFH